MALMNGNQPLLPKQYNEQK
uniref:Uncharacterized protein n=1 Tax=Anguilla anguilla TaxID=7936 RepID=A0A0E9T709_ANGAN